jgi:hypothetical protein
MYHINKLHSELSTVNKEETKPVAVYDHSQNMGAIHLRDQMLQPPLKCKEGSKWCMKLFRMLLNAVIHNTMVTYQSMLNK